MGNKKLYRNSKRYQCKRAKKQRQIWANRKALSNIDAPRANSSDMGLNDGLQHHDPSTSTPAKITGNEHLESQSLQLGVNVLPEHNVQREERLERKRLAATMSRAGENEAQRKERLERKRLSAARSRAAESEEERKDRLEKMRLAAARSRAAEDEEKRKNRLEKMRLRTARSRAEENEAQREERLERMRLATARSRAMENEEERGDRLEKMRLATTMFRAVKKYKGTFATLPCHNVCKFSARIAMYGAPDTMRPNMDIPKIGTHDRTFHCAEVFACYLLKQLPEYENATIVRTRNSEILKTCDIVVDVGEEYDPSRHRYDHHQRSFDGTMKSLSVGPKPWVTKLSSAGLVYLHFGHCILTQLLGAKKDDEIVEKLFDKIYEDFVEEIDAIDNGISVCPDKPKYVITTNISARVGHLNPYWNDNIRRHYNTEDRFHKAIALVGEEFKERVDFYAKAWWPARELVKASILQRFKVDEGGEIIELDTAGYPWKDHLFTLEEELMLVPTLKFVIFLDGAGSCRVQAVPISSNSFESRIPLLNEWRGLRGEELSQKSGIPGGIFVQASGCIGGNKTREGALKMAKVTLAKYEEVVAL